MTSCTPNSSLMLQISLNKVYKKHKGYFIQIILGVVKCNLSFTMEKQFYIHPTKRVTGTCKYFETQHQIKIGYPSLQVSFNWIILHQLMCTYQSLTGLSQFFQQTEKRNSSLILPVPLPWTTEIVPLTFILHQPHLLQGQNAIHSTISKAFVNKMKSEILEIIMLPNIICIPEH